MSTKAELIRENKQLVKERKEAKASYLKTLHKLKTNLEERIGEADKIDLLLSKVTFLEKSLARKESILLDLRTYSNKFLTKPWWVRMFYTKEQLRVLFNHGE